MSKYNVSISYTAFKTITVEADSMYDAKEKAYESEESCVCLCHHCSKLIDISDDFEIEGVEEDE